MIETLRRIASHTARGIYALLLLNGGMSTRKELLEAGYTSTIIQEAMGEDYYWRSLCFGGTNDGFRNLGGYYYASRKADTLYWVCTMVVAVPFLISLVISLIIFLCSPLFWVVIFVAPMIPAVLMWIMEVLEKARRG